VSDALFEVDAGGAFRLPGVPIGADEIADRLGLPRPTEQQRAVIEAPLEPRIVVAGAGSGKTETMANRVVWLVANGFVAVPEVLGLTFTRKAAGELAARIRSRIVQLAESSIADVEFDPFAAPAIATYNSFANSIFREHAVLIGREGEAGVLSEASAWQLARRIVVGSDDPRLVELDKRPDAVTSAVLTLSRALAENVASASDVRSYAADFARLAELPTGSAAIKDVFGALKKAIEPVAALPLLLDLAEQYDAEKQRRAVVEFSDQIALALRIAESSPRVVDDYRDRYKVVLLDEYQDTSVVQTRLLSTIFHGHPVMAVGDPHQSIYGWRGASAANLARFAEDFGAADASAFALSTSWRNPRVVLAAANELVAPLSAGSRIPVERLGPRPGVKAGSLDVRFAETVRDEADEVAAWFATELDRRSATGERRSAALLCRSVKKIDAFTDALDARDIPYHVLGIGGLLSEPAVADLVSALRVLYYPTAGPDLVRLLAGARWRIGAKDLVALSALASWLAERDHRFRALDDDVRRQIRGSVVADEDRSIVDALDFVAAAPPAHSALRGFSDEGLERMRAAGSQLAHLRTRAGLGLVDFVGLVEQELLLDVEALAARHAGAARASLDAFSEQLVGFLALDPSAALGDFLSWLEEAERRDRLAPRSEEPEPGTVQILTIHGAKGLEWDIVAIPRMVEDELPGKPKSSRGWLAFGELPYAFRGDASELPHLSWRGIEKQNEFGAAFDAFRAENSRQHADEQRRLAYVAVTRARENLLLSGSFWSTQLKPRGPGAYLIELQDAGIIASGALPDGPRNDTNPLAELEEWVLWPHDPLGSRRTRVTAAAAAVRSADPRAATRWDHDIEVLLAERERLRSPLVLEAPARIPASRFKDYVADPDAVARALRRPMPERPFRQTRLGTRFHAWVEERFARGGAAELGGDTIDDVVGDGFGDDDMVDRGSVDRGSGGHGSGGHGSVDHRSGDRGSVGLSDAVGVAERADADAEARMADLIGNFESSEFAGRTPVEVETEIHLVLGERVVVCKIDAIFAEGDRFHIVDWKTGRAPKDAADLELKQFQLALYRLAYARWRGIDLSRIDASFYFVADDRVVRPDRLYSEAELTELVQRPLV
jgi:DNA helicase-2/ATP-dependent DNA helicase PcrA